MTRDNPPFRFRDHGLPLLALLAAVAAVYGRMLGHQFLLNWDDNIYVTGNYDVLSPSPEGILTVFTTYYAGNYAPVQMLSYMLDSLLWGLWPGGFLLTNMVIHAANGLLLYLLLLRWHGKRLTATVGAAIFLLHPVQVESVAWISQRKNLLAMLLFLAAWWLYDRYREADGRRRRFFYIVSVIAFLLSLLAKSAAVILPVVLLLFDYCFPVAERRVRLTDKLPYLVAAGVVALTALHSQQPDTGVWGAGGGRVTAYHGGSLLATAFTMLPVYAEYLRMLVWPAQLSAEYDPAIRQSVDIAVTFSLLLLVGLAFLCQRLFRYDRRLGFWPLYAVIAFLPVSQIVPLVTLMNDRYFYFPMVGCAALAGCGAERLMPRFGESRRRLVWGVLAAPLVVLALVSFQRVGVWQDAVTLWRDAVRKSPAKASAWERLGEACHFSFPSHREEAERAYLKALELHPKSDISMYNLGLLYTDMGEYGRGEVALRRLLASNPANVMGWAALGDIHLYREEYESAEGAYKRAAELQPDAIQVVKLLGNLALVRKRYDEARVHLLRAEREGWGDAVNALRLACTEAGAGRRDDALNWLESSLQRGLTDVGAAPCLDELSLLQGEVRFNRLIDTYLPDGRRRFE